jgi:PAS domain S-box-containing protein
MNGSTHLGYFGPYLLLAGIAFFALLQALYIAWHDPRERQLALPGALAAAAAWLVLSSYLRHAIVDPVTTAWWYRAQALAGLLAFALLVEHVRRALGVARGLADSAVLAALGGLVVVNFFTPWGVLSGDLDLVALAAHRASAVPVAAFTPDWLAHLAAVVIALAMLLCLVWGLRAYARTRSLPILASTALPALAAVHDLLHNSLGVGVPAILTVYALVGLGVTASFRQVQRAIQAASAERALAHSEQRASATFEALSEGVVVIDASGRIERTNAAAVELLGPAITPARLLVGAFDLEDSAGSILEATYARARAGERVVIPGGVRLRSMGGRSLVVGLVAAPLPDPEGRTGMVLVLRDLREQLAYEARLQRARDLELSDRLAGSVVKDLEQLVQTIRGGSGRLRAWASEHDGVSADLDALLQATETASQLAARLAGAQVRVAHPPTAVALNPLLERAGRTLRRLVPASIEVQLELDDRAPWGCVDAVAIETALVNLGTNAAHAMPSGGRIELRSALLDAADRTSGDWEIAPGPGDFVSLEVRDHGVGIDQAHRDRLFEPFYSTKAFGEGTGLGLPMVHHTVEVHHGGLLVQSQPGRGSRFVIAVPAWAPVAAAAPKVMSPGSPRGI